MALAQAARGDGETALADRPALVPGYVRLIDAAEGGVRVLISDDVLPLLEVEAAVAVKRVADNAGSRPGWRPGRCRRSRHTQNLAPVSNHGFLRGLPAGGKQRPVRFLAPRGPEVVFWRNRDTPSLALLALSYWFDDRRIVKTDPWDARRVRRLAVAGRCGRRRRIRSPRTSRVAVGSARSCGRSDGRERRHRGTGGSRSRPPQGRAVREARRC